MLMEVVEKNWVKVETLLNDKYFMVTMQMILAQLSTIFQMITVSLFFPKLNKAMALALLLCFWYTTDPADVSLKMIMVFGTSNITFL